MLAKTSTIRQLDRLKPKLCVAPGMSHVNVRRLAILQTVEEESKATNS